jgi:hypothetical protein
MSTRERPKLFSAALFGNLKNERMLLFVVFEILLIWLFALKRSSRQFPWMVRCLLMTRDPSIVRLSAFGRHEQIR